MTGRFIRQLRKLQLFYSPKGGSSAGMRSYLDSKLVQFATSNPHVVVEALCVNNSRHPFLKACFVSGKQNVVGVKNLTATDIEKHVKALNDSMGEKVPRTVKPVITRNSSIQGNWNPLTAKKDHLSKR
eukprot:m.19204 g.19204  ORF g.19204 m.19204 type:complete len:128 (+) comp6508_c0_seq3:116-499(+)